MIQGRRRGDRRGRAPLSSPLLLAALALAGCASLPGRSSAPHATPPWQRVTPDDPVVLVIGVVDLRRADLDSLPALGRTFAHATRHPDVLSAGAGSAAALTLLDGRAPLDHLRMPMAPLAAARAAGWDAAVMGVPGTLRSEPEWVDAALGEAPVRALRAELPAWSQVPDGRVWRVLLLDPFADLDAPARPRTGIHDPASLRWLDAALSEWIESLRGGTFGDRLHVVLTGIPRAPSRQQRARALPGTGTLSTALEVPWQWLAPRDRGVELDAGRPALVHELVADALGTRRERRADPRWSAWWSDFSGGVLLELPASGERPAVRAWLDEYGQWATADAVDSLGVLDLRRAELDSISRDLLFGADPTLWCAVRGSEDIDFVELDIVTDDVGTAMQPWALEEIDIVRTPSDRVRTLALAVEALGDGAVLALGWPPRTVELRISGEMAGTPLLGIPIRLGADERITGFGSQRIAPFTRPFWRANAGAWPVSADTWWPTARSGLHVGIAAGVAPPTPAQWQD